MNKKMLLLLVVCGLFSMADIASHLYKSHKIQVVLNPNAEGWTPAFSFWAFNTAAGGLTYTFTANRDLGGYYVASGLIFPKGTVNKYQGDYSLDHRGNSLLTVPNLGSWLATEFIMTGYNYNESFPASGTLLTQGTWSFFFNDSEEKDNVYAVGRQKANILGEGSSITGQPVQYGRFDANAGSGKYAQLEARPNVTKANWYLSTVGNVLIDIEFDKDIEVFYS